MLIDSVVGELKLLNALKLSTQKNTMEELRQISEKGREDTACQRDSPILCSFYVIIQRPFIIPQIQAPYNGLNI